MMLPHAHLIFGLDTVDAVVVLVAFVLAGTTAALLVAAELLFAWLSSASAEASFWALSIVLEAGCALLVAAAFVVTAAASLAASGSLGVVVVALVVVAGFVDFASIESSFLGLIAPSCCVGNCASSDLGSTSPWPNSFFQGIVCRRAGRVVSFESMTYCVS